MRQDKTARNNRKVRECGLKDRKDLSDKPDGTAEGEGKDGRRARNNKKVDRIYIARDVFMRKTSENLS